MSKNSNVTVNRQYKSTVFTMLFSQPHRLLSLYNALNDSSYSNPEELQIVTLENAVYMSMKNDNAFILGQTLNLYEHQSTVNPNMPLRFLFYVSREYEKFVIKKSLYSSKKLELPTPNFVVFYNGIARQPKRQVMKLSDSYTTKNGCPNLELRVLFLNINGGNNSKLKKNCDSLREYMLFVEKIRHNINLKKLSVEEAVEKAIKHCIRKNILKEFLLENYMEVMAMSIFEYDEEKEMMLLREEMYQEGLSQGREEGLSQGREEGLSQGREEGRAQGREEGFIQGREEEKLNGLKILVVSLKQCLSDFDAVYEAVIRNEEYREFSKEKIRQLYSE